MKFEIENLTRNERRIFGRIYHKIYMALISAERGNGGPALSRYMINSLRQDAEEIAAHIWPEYQERDRTAALWLARCLRAEYWLMDAQSASWERQRAGGRQDFVIA